MSRPQYIKGSNSNVGLLLTIAISILFLVIAVICFIVAIRIKNKELKLKELCTEHTNAEVVSSYKTRLMHGSTVESGSVQYTWITKYKYYVDDKEITVQSSTGTSKQMNGKVELWYNPRNPEQIYIPEEHMSRLATYLYIIATSFIGVSLFTIAMLVYLRNVK